MKKNHCSYTRRHFLQRCGMLALGSSSAMATLTRLQLAQAQTLPADDYKALVCVFLFGGNDAFNMLVPRSTDTYAAYSATRQDLAAAQNTLLPINTNQQAGQEFGLHPELSDLAELYTDGKLAFLGNVGALIEPTTKAAYQSKSAPLPPQLFSHNDQQNFVQSLQSGQRRDGWAGRAAELMANFNSNPNLSMNISLSGNNLWQAAGNIIPYSVNPEGVTALRNLERTLVPDPESENYWGALREQSRVQALQDILNQPHAHRLISAYAASLNKAWDLADEVGAALVTAPEVDTVFPAENRMAAGLQMAAKIIAARNALGSRRQTFFIGVGDFDTHGDQVRRHNILMQQLNDALSAFYAATVELGVADKVTTFTASDFGRTLTSNGDGTDHGWGSHQIILGDAVKGGEIYGQMPDLAIGSENDGGEGRIIPTTSIDQYSATLASWFGLPAQHFAEVFPNLIHFDNADLGFFQS